MYQCSCLSFLIGIVNTILLATGSAIIWIGYMVRYDSVKLFSAILPKMKESINIFNYANERQVQEILGPKIGLAILIVGVIIVMLSLFGLLSAILQLAVFEIPYLIMLSVILIACIVLTIVFGTQNELVRKGLTNLELDLFKHHYNFTSKGDFTGVWNQIQQDLKCCGVKGFDDYTNYITSKPKDLKVPESCCINKSGCVSDPNAENANLRGCSEALWDLILKHYKNFLIGMVITDLIIFVPLVFTLVLLCRRPKQ